MKDTTDPNILVEYLRRSYFVVDGLWFVKTEETSSFDHALDLDEEVWRILAKIQTRKARELLAGGQLSVSEVAYKSGFSTQAHFSRVFSENMGCSPSEYRKSLATKGH